MIEQWRRHIKVVFQYCSCRLIHSIQKIVYHLQLSIYPCFVHHRDTWRIILSEWIGHDDEFNSISHLTNFFQ